VRVGTARVGRAHMVLHGHRSIVNQVRYNKSSALIISSGVEKIIKACVIVLRIVTLLISCESKNFLRNLCLSIV